MSKIFQLVLLLVFHTDFINNVLPMYRNSQKAIPGAKGRLVPQRRTKKLSRKDQEAVRERNALREARRKLGDVKFKTLQSQWASLDTGNGGTDQSTANGMIVCLIQQQLTQREIRAVFGCGKGRIRRVRASLRNPERNTKEKKPPHHAATDLEKEEIKRFIRTYETEDGFSCSHRRQQKYLVLQGLT